MKLQYDYLALLENQCDCIYPKADLRLSKLKFSEVCRNLGRDFLPPIEREDIAALSYSLVEVASKAENTKCDEKLKKQFILLKEILKSLFEKRKTCEDEIRRLIDFNISFNTVDQNQKQLNDALADLYKTVLLAYFKNL